MERRIIADDRARYARRYRPSGTLTTLDRVYHFFAPLHLAFAHDANGFIREIGTGRLVVEFRRAGVCAGCRLGRQHRYRYHR